MYQNDNHNLYKRINCRANSPVMHKNMPMNPPAYTQGYYPIYSCPYAIPPYPFIPNQFNYRATPFYAEPLPESIYINLQDYGPGPFVVNIHEAAKQNTAFRTALWTGNHLQLTLMSLDVGEDIGLEIHEDLDQFIRIEEGTGIVIMGESRDRMDFQAYVDHESAFIIPAGTWHNLINTDHRPLKLFSIYAPPQHPYGTVHERKEDAMTAQAYEHENMQRE